jgi:hypothetical protein
MATTDIKIKQQADFFVPDKSSVPIVTGDSVTFYADPDAQTNLCMTSDTAAILSPTPDVTVMIAPGDSVSFQFASAGPGFYCILAQSADWPYPDQIDCGSAGSAAVLLIRPNKQKPYSGPEGDPET